MQPMEAKTSTVDPATAIPNSRSSTSSLECRQFSFETIALQGLGFIVIVLFLQLPVAEILPDLLFPQVKVFILALCTGVLLGWMRPECLLLGLLSTEETLHPQLIERLGVIGGIVLLFSSFIPFVLAASHRWSDLDRGTRTIYAITATIVSAEIILLVGTVVSLIYFVWGFSSSTPFG